MTPKSTTVTIPRARFEAIARQTIALREQVDALTLLMQSELVGDAVDPRTEKDAAPNTFGRRTA